MPYVVSQPQGSPKEPTGPRVPTPQASQPAPASFNPTGKWTVRHPDWAGTFTLHENNTFTDFSGEAGSWSFNGRILTLVFQKRPMGALEIQPDGTFFVMLPKGAFRLRRA